MAIDNALPWFPLTPDYIDKYYSDVLKYLRDSFEMEESEIRSDKSFCTTASLLMQRAEEVRAKYVSRSLIEVRSAPRSGIEKDAKIVAAAVLYARNYPFDVVAVLHHCCAVPGTGRSAFLHSPPVCKGFGDHRSRVQYG